MILNKRRTELVSLKLTLFNPFPRSDQLLVSPWNIHTLWRSSKQVVRIKKFINQRKMPWCTSNEFSFWASGFTFKATPKGLEYACFVSYSKREWYFNFFSSNGSVEDVIVFRKPFMKFDNKVNRRCKSSACLWKENWRFSK